MVRHPKPAAMRLPNRLTMTPEAVLALQQLEDRFGQPILDARCVRWRCGCTLWYYRVSFGELAERSTVIHCDVHRG